jgi:hypothetical protein
VSVGSTVGLFLFSMSVCRCHRWFVFVFYECLLVPPLVCFCFLWVSVVSTVGLFLFSMSVYRCHRWFVFVFYECLSVAPLVCFCFLWVSVGATVGLFLFSICCFHYYGEDNKKLYMSWYFLCSVSSVKIRGECWFVDNI